MVIFGMKFGTQLPPQNRNSILKKQKEENDGNGGFSHNDV